MTARIYLKQADGSGSIQSGEIDGHDRVVSELDDRYQSGPALSETDMRTLVREKFERLINEDSVTDASADALLESFREELHEWQRTADKVVLLLKYEDYLIISHGYNEDGSYFTGDDYEVGERILDTDNIISSAKITRETSNEYQLDYHTRSNSDYFRRYIGLSDAVIEENQIYITFDYKGNGVDTHININESEFSENPNIAISATDCKLTLYGDEHPLQKVSWNSSTYDGSTSHRLRDFLTDLDKKRNRLHTHDSKIDNIEYNIKKADDDKEIVEGLNHVNIGDSKYSKIGAEGDVLPIYATSEYDRLAPEFLSSIIERVVGGSVLRLYGPAAGYTRDPLTVPTDGSDTKIEFRSIDDARMDSSTKDIIDSIYQDIRQNIRDEMMAKMLTRVLFELVDISSDTDTEYLRKICDSFSITQDRSVEHENDVIEYKRELPDSPLEEMIRESNPSGLKILIWGITEDEKYQVTPLEQTPDSDTCRRIEQRCEAETGLDEVKIHEVDVDSEDISGKIMFGLMLGDSSATEALSQVFG